MLRKYKAIGKDLRRKVFMEKKIHIVKKSEAVCASTFFIRQEPDLSDPFAKPYWG